MLKRKNWNQKITNSELPSQNFVVIASLPDCDARWIPFSYPIFADAESLFNIVAYALHQSLPKFMQIADKKPIVSTLDETQLLHRSMGGQVDIGRADLISEST